MTCSLCNGTAELREAVQAWDEPGAEVPACPQCGEEGVSERCDCCERPERCLMVYESPHGDMALCEDCETELLADVIELSRRSDLARRFQRVRQKQK